MVLSMCMMGNMVILYNELYDILYFFFFQAEDGIRDVAVTGVQTCALPIWFDWANQNRDQVAGIAYMEAIVTPLTWEDWPDDGRGIFQGFRSPAGEELVDRKSVV